jgi:RimJ/RimL family protein N-acetyltransferase/predicted nucleotidyltransferase
MRRSRPAHAYCERVFAPTASHELNAVLDEFAASVRAILGENFCGVYLQGSFALGDADEYSDVDFIVATHDEVTDTELAGLQAMHERLYALESPWAQHLEGSYVPRRELRHVDHSRAPYWYLDNGTTELVRDNHCNTAVVRWSLRERGVVLAGPEPKSLVEPVSAADLSDDVRWAMREWADWLPHNDLSRRAQSLLVLTVCRMLYTVEFARVSTKREAGEWALRALDLRWSSLIQDALDDRPDPWTKVHEPAVQEASDRTLAFFDFAMKKTAPDRVAVRLEPWSKDDFQLLERLMGDPVMTEHLGGPVSPEKLRERQARYEKATDSRARMFKIVDEATGEPLGSVGYWEREWRDEQIYESGWSVLTEFQGRGIATAATAQAIELAREENKHRYLHAFPPPENGPSNAICRKLGFTLLGEVEFEFPPGHVAASNDWRLDLWA